MITNPNVSFSISLTRLNRFKNTVNIFINFIYLFFLLFIRLTLLNINATCKLSISCLGKKLMMTSKDLFG